MAAASADATQQLSGRHKKGGCHPIWAIPFARPGGRVEMIQQPFQHLYRLKVLCGAEAQAVVFLLARFAVRPLGIALVEPLVFLFYLSLKNPLNTGFLVAPRLVEVGLVGQGRHQ